MGGFGGIQTTVGTLQSPAVAGDWCDSNPRYSVDAGPFGLISGPNGLIVGRFAWLDQSGILDADGTPAQANNYGIGVPNGFVHRENQALITTYLADSSLLIPAGYNITLMSGGGVWAYNAGSTEALFGNKAFAYLNSGLVAFAPAGTIFGGASGVTASIAAETFSVTGSIAPVGGGGYDAPSILTVTVVGSGTVYPGASISGANIPTTPAPQIVSQLTPLLSGEALGGVGRYYLNTGEITFASGTVSGTYGLMSNGTVTGTFAVNDQLTGTDVVAGTTITALVTGAGGSGGTSVVNNNTVVNSTTITASAAIETAFFARSTGLPTELVKISNQLTP
jgi:hypothetical protein